MFCVRNFISSRFDTKKRDRVIEYLAMRNKRNLQYSNYFLILYYSKFDRLAINSFNQNMHRYLPHKLKVSPATLTKLYQFILLLLFLG